MSVSVCVVSLCRGWRGQERMEGVEGQEGAGGEVRYCGK